MKKKTKIVIAIAIAFIIAIIASFTVGCHAPKTNTANISTATTITAEAAENNFGFAKISSDYLNTTHEKVFFYREVSTDVMYIAYCKQESYAGMGGLTVMLDPETGGPLTYENWVNNYKSK